MADVQQQLGDFIFAILEKIDEAGGSEAMAEKIRTSLANANGEMPDEPNGNQAVASTLAHMILQSFKVVPKDSFD
jgi:hypothetical protein